MYPTLPERTQGEILGGDDDIGIRILFFVNILFILLRETGTEHKQWGEVEGEADPLLSWEPNARTLGS